METSKNPKFSGASSSLHETLLLLQRVITAAVTSIVVTDPGQPDNPIIYHNPAFERMTGYTRPEIDGHNCRFLQGPETDPAAVAQLRQAIQERQNCQVTLLNYQKDGTPFWNELALSPVYASDGSLTHFVGVQNDVTQRKAAEQERDLLLAQQQRVADTLQRALLLTPPQTFPHLEVSTQYEPASDEAQFGGDFFDVFALTEDQVALVVGDVTGKGLQAAQHTAEIKYALRVLLREYGAPVAALRRLNRFLVQAHQLDGRETSSFVCIALALVNTRTGLLTVTAAGIEPPLIVRADTGAADVVPTSGLMLGIDPDADYEAHPVTLTAGDVLILATDGITEARCRTNRQFFGYDGLITAAQSATGTLAERGAQIVARARAFADGDQQDDICVMLARRPAASVAPAALARPEGFPSPVAE